MHRHQRGVDFRSRPVVAADPETIMIDRSTDRRRTSRRSGQTDSNTVAEREDSLLRLWTLRFCCRYGKMRRRIERNGLTNAILVEKIQSAMREIGSHDLKANSALDVLNSELKIAQRSAEQTLLPEGLRNNVRRLRELFDLTEVEADILTLAIMLSTDLDLASQLKVSKSLTLDDVIEIVSVVLDFSVRDVQSAINSASGLYKHGLLRTELAQSKRKGLAAWLTPYSPDHVAKMMQDSEKEALLIEDAFTKDSPTELVLEDFSYLGQSLDFLTAHFRRSVESGKTGVNYLLHGDRGSGKTEFCRAFSKEVDRVLLEVAQVETGSEVMELKQRTCAVLLSQRIAEKLGGFVVVDNADELLLHFGQRYMNASFRFQARNCEFDEAGEPLERMMASNPVPTVWIVRDQDDVFDEILAEFDGVYEMQSPSSTRLREMVKKQLPGCEESLVRRIASVPGINRATIHAARDFASTIADSPQSSVWVEAFIEAFNARQKIRKKPVIGTNVPTLRTSLYHERYVSSQPNLDGVMHRIGEECRARLLLYGPPGTGKTAWAGNLAKELDIDLVQVTASQIQHHYPGRAERRIRKVFSKAQQSGALLLFDEADTFLYDRRNAHRSWEVSFVNEFLTQLENYTGLIAATTNLRSLVDSAAIRRFDIKVEFKFLEFEQVTGLFRAYCERYGLRVTDERELDELRNIGVLTPGDFAAVDERSRFFPIRSVEQFREALIDECSLKPDSNRQFGFQ